MATAQLETAAIEEGLVAIESLDAISPNLLLPWQDALGVIAKIVAGVETTSLSLFHLRVLTPTQFKSKFKLTNKELSIIARMFSKLGLKFAHKDRGIDATPPRLYIVKSDGWDEAAWHAGKARWHKLLKFLGRSTPVISHPADQVDVEEVTSSTPQPDQALQTTGEGVRLDPHRIRRFEGQPREHFDENEMEELRESIRTAGQDEPILVMRIEGDPNHDYELVDGERRWRVCKELQRPIWAVIVSVKNAAEQYIRSAVGNLGRAGHGPVEIAHMIKNIMDRTGMNQSRAAKLFGKKPAWASQHLSLLKLHDTVLEMMHPSNGRKRLGFVSARELSDLPQEDQITAARKIVDENMTVGRARALIRTIIAGKNITTVKRKRRPSDTLRVLREFLLSLGHKLEPFSSLSLDELMGLFASRENPLEDIAEVLETLGDRHETISSLLASLRKIEKVLK